MSPGQTYEFEVSAVNLRGEGPKSSPPLQVIAATVPDAPVNLRKNTASISLITIDWTQPSFDGDSPILDYEVWWDEGSQSDSYERLVDTTGNSLTYTKTTDLVAGNKYSFKVRAINAVGEGAFSEALSVIAGTIPD